VEKTIEDCKTEKRDRERMCEKECLREDKNNPTECLFKEGYCQDQYLSNKFLLSDSF